MTSPLILNLMSSCLKGKISNDGKASGNVSLLKLKSTKGSRHVFSDMLKAFKSHQNSVIHTTDKSSKMNSKSIDKGYKYYLESIKKELLSQGKPLNKTFLKEKDLALVKTFLLQCGFSHEKVERFLKDLKENNSNGEINLSQLFLKMTELGTPKRKEHQAETIELSTVPYIESILRDFNLTQKELDKVFSSARIEGVGLDLHKLVTKLKEIQGRNSSMNIRKKGDGDQISLEDFITRLERITENLDKGNKLTADAKNTLGKIIERVESTEQKSPPASFVRVTSDYNLTGSFLKDGLNKKSHPVLGKNESNKNGSIPSFLKEKDVKIQNHIEPKTDTANNFEKTDLLSNLNKKIELINPIKEKGYGVDTKAELINVQRNFETFNIPNMAKAVDQGEKPFRGYLPASLVDQVGKQISRSILRGDQVVTLQLKPPDLGKVRIKMDIKDHSLKLGMIAEHHSVKELLLSNVHELKEALVQHGVKLEKVDVQINYNFGQSLNASKEGTDNGQDWRKDLNGEPFHSENHTEGLQDRSAPVLSGSKLLDLVA